MCVEEKRNILKKTLTTHIVKDTMRIDADDTLFLEGDKCYYGVSDIQKRIFAGRSDYVRRSRSTHVEFLLHTQNCVSWIMRQI